MSNKNSNTEKERIVLQHAFRIHLASKTKKKRVIEKDKKILFRLSEANKDKIYKCAIENNISVTTICTQGALLFCEQLKSNKGEKLL